MAKYKIGDKVKVVANTATKDKTAGWHVYGQGVVNIGAIGVIESIDNGFVEVRFNKKDIDGITLNDPFRELRFDEIELVEPKPTKNQRIAALEETAKHMRAELDKAFEVEQDLLKRVSELELIVEGLRKPSTVVQESLTTTSSVEDKTQSEGERLVKQCEQHFSPVEKSPNEKRAEMIEKAKMFIEGNKNSDGYYNVYDNNGISFPQIPFHCKVEFIVNEEKRTVIALMRGFQSNRVLAKGIAKCMPGDVFNEHIGKAIALGRALGLDVSEFEQAVQPSHYAVGQIGVAPNLGFDNKYRVDEIGTDQTLTKLFSDGGKAWANTTLPLNYEDGFQRTLTIIDDTNAIYTEGAQ